MAETMLKGFTGSKEGSTMPSRLVHASFKLHVTAFLTAVTSEKTCHNFSLGYWWADAEDLGDHRIALRQ